MLCNCYKAASHRLMLSVWNLFKLLVTNRDIPNFMISSWMCMYVSSAWSGGGHSCWQVYNYSPLFTSTSPASRQQKCAMSCHFFTGLWWHFKPATSTPGYWLFSKLIYMCSQSRATLIKNLIILCKSWRLLYFRRCRISLWLGAANARYRFSQKDIKQDEEHDAVVFITSWTWCKTQLLKSSTTFRNITISNQLDLAIISNQSVIRILTYFSLLGLIIILSSLKVSSVIFYFW